MITQATAPQVALEAARRRRSDLKNAISRTEAAAAAPAGDPSWRSTLQYELANLGRALQTHIAEVEADNGLLNQLRHDTPRLVNRIDRVGAEHPLLTSDMNTLLASEKDLGTEDLRAGVLAILLALVRHRQRGADLVWEGYSVDIGGG